ncbi:MULTISPECIES: hypothetical protein [Flammeovirga]|uniref:Uncharacterized protein n=1 Tax=Flammeovirga agarivorans TaxID=2726742 RepID=A0A7X8XVR1_9BACT|nr:MULTISPECIES: hypothetical protein [Flammeovirga]NLR91578.1 hypothetical protein [Flammeovirga agarivorans]
MLRSSIFSLILALSITSCSSSKKGYVDHNKPETVKWLKSGDARYANKRDGNYVKGDMSDQRYQEIIAEMVMNNIPTQPLLIQISGKGMVEYFETHGFKIQRYEGRIQLKDAERYKIYPDIELKLDFEPLTTDYPTIYADLSYIDQKIWVHLIRDAGFRVTVANEQELAFKLPRKTVKDSK